VALDQRAQLLCGRVVELLGGDELSVEPKVEEARWTKRLDAKATFPAADPWTGASGTEYLILDVGGNKYRVVARPVFKTQTLIIMAVMTHDEYQAGRWKKGL